jgi:hypothetical protein
MYPYHKPIYGSGGKSYSLPSSFSQPTQARVVTQPAPNSNSPLGWNTCELWPFPLLIVSDEVNSAVKLKRHLPIGLNIIVAGNYKRASLELASTIFCGLVVVLEPNLHLNTSLINLLKIADEKPDYLPLNVFGLSKANHWKAPLNDVGVNCLFNLPFEPDTLNCFLLSLRKTTRQKMLEKWAPY